MTAKNRLPDEGPWDGSSTPEGGAGDEMAEEGDQMRLVKQGWKGVKMIKMMP